MTPRFGVTVNMVPKHIEKIGDRSHADEVVGAARKYLKNRLPVTDYPDDSVEVTIRFSETPDKNYIADIRVQTQNPEEPVKEFSIGNKYDKVDFFLGEVVGVIRQIGVDHGVLDGKGPKNLKAL